MTIAVPFGNTWKVHSSSILQHFLHIANNGYTFEKNLAFFPLYPLAVQGGCSFQCRTYSLGTSTNNEIRDESLLVISSGNSVIALWFIVLVTR